MTRRAWCRGCRGIAWKMMGFEHVYTAFNAAEAREILKKAEIAVMLCDIEMPVENGLSLLGWMRGEQMETECIFLTAHADFEYMQEAIREGLRLYFTAGTV